MFDNYYTAPARDRNVYVNTEITERRAPTDESLKLLKEMQEKALKSVVASGQTENNEFHCRWEVFDNYLYDTKIVFVVFKLNGVEYKWEITVPMFKSTEEIPEYVFESVCQKLASEVFMQDFGKVFSKSIRGY